jgi:chromosome segregation ATPase
MTSTEYLPEGPPLSKRRNWWIWVSAGLAVVILGLVIWQFNTQSDLDAAKAQVKDLQAQIENGSDTAAAYQAAYKDLEQQLGATQQDLAATQQELTDAQQTAQAADAKAADAAQRAEDATSDVDKAEAEADQARAELEAAESRATIAKDCANAFVGELTTVAQSPDPTAAAQAAKAELQGIVSDCQAALAGS